MGQASYLSGITVVFSASAEVRINRMASEYTGNTSETSLSQTSVNKNSTEVTAVTYRYKRKWETHKQLAGVFPANPPRATRY